MRFGRSPEPNEVQLVAELESSRGQLIRVEAESATAIGNARGEVTKAQGRLDTFRRALVRDHADVWRNHAAELRRRAEDAGDETVVVPVRKFLGQGDSGAEPTLRYRRVVLAEEAAAADGKAAWLDGYLARGDALTSQDLAVLVSQLEPLPQAEAIVAA
jgi:hypothetical protein